MVVQEIKNQGLFSNCIKSADIIVDKAVIKNNTWFLYGSSKPPNADPYKLTQVFNQNLNDITHEHNTDDNHSLIKQFSVYNNLDLYYSKNASPINNFISSPYDSNESEEQQPIKKKAKPNNKASSPKPKQKPKKTKPTKTTIETDSESETETDSSFTSGNLEEDKK